MEVKHTYEQCHQALEGIKNLLNQLKHINDLELRKHLCESAIEICDNLLREPPE
jgi:hypothetical protein